MCLIFAILCTCASTHIVIDIEPEELQRVAEILVQNYVDHNLGPIPTSTTKNILPLVIKFALHAMQLIGITITLVSANLITSMFESTSESIIPDNITTTFKPSEMCNRDFGCERNVCWRECGAANGKNNSWCYTTQRPELYEYQQCLHSYECSPCWECLGPCHSQK